MAIIQLNNGAIVGSATENKDTVSVKSDTLFHIYTVYTLGGSDVVNLSKAYSTSYIQLYTGSGDDTVTGGRGTYYDGSGADTYHAGGDVQFRAGAGDDIYDGGKGDDIDVIDFRFAPSDDGFGTANTQNMIVDLAKTARQNFGVFGNDSLISIENALGGTGNDKIFGSAASNQLNGDAGNDVLIGRGGKDQLFGEDGGDTLNGGGGADRMDAGIGVAARDTFLFTSKTDFGTFQANPPFGSPTWDVVIGFDKGGSLTDDMMDLSRIDPLTLTGDQGFTWIGGQAFHASAKAEIRITSIKASPFDSVKSTLVELDWDSDNKAEASFIVQYVTGLTKSDFVL